MKGDDFTDDELDRALNRLAAAINARGAAGERLLPLYRRLEDAAARREADRDTMAAVRKRLALPRLAGQQKARQGSQRRSDDVR